MSSPGSKKPGFSRRDMTMLAGFAFFAEAIALYMLLIDGPLALRGKAMLIYHRTQATFGSLNQSMAERKIDAEHRAQRAALLQWVRLRPGEPASVVVQRTLGEMLQRSGTQLKGITLTPQPIASSSVVSYQTTLTVLGPYEGIMGLANQMKQASTSIGIHGIAMRLSPGVAHDLSAEFDLNIYLRP